MPWGMIHSPCSPTSLSYSADVTSGRASRCTRRTTGSSWMALALVGLRWSRVSLTQNFIRPRQWWGQTGEGAAMLLGLSLAGTLVELGSLQERYSFYFTLLFPTVAMLGGWALAGIVGLCRDAQTNKGAIQVAVGALVCAALWVPVDAWANATAYPEEIAKAGEIVHFDWTPSPVLPALGEIAHALVWEDARTRGDSEPAIRHFLWTKKHTFATAPEIAAYIDAHTSPRDTNHRRVGLCAAHRAAGAPPTVRQSGGHQLQGLHDRHHFGRRFLGGSVSRQPRLSRRSGRGATSRRARSTRDRWSRSPSITRRRSRITA